MRSAFFALILSAAAFAAQPDYFPLQAGNQWTYRATGLGQSFTVEVTGTATAGDQTYFVLEGFPRGAVWLRMADDGTLYAYNPETKSESVWAAFGTPVGQSYATTIDACSPTARIRSKAAHAEIPVGSFDTALAIDYPPVQCADAGLTSELYLPYIGLVQRTETSFGGPIVYDLVYARMNFGLTTLTAAEQSFTVSLDSSSYKGGADATVRMTIRNTQSTPLALTFNSGQRFDVTVKNEQGSVVYGWSRDKLFAQQVSEIEIAGEKTWTLAFPVPAVSGKYTLEAWLATATGSYRGQLSLAVQ